MAGLIDAIINPAQADVIGSLEKGQQRADRDLAGEILGQTFTGKLGALARSNPEMAQSLAKEMGIPTTSKGRIDNFLGIAVVGQQFADAGIPRDQIAQFFRDEGLKIQESISATGGVGSADRLLSFADRYEAGDPASDDELAALALAGSPKGEALAAIPSSLTKDLPDDMAARVGDAFTAAGGGDKGIKAANEERILVKEDMRRGNARESLATIYPNVTNEEMTQLQAAIDTAPSVEKGMATAETIRTNQRAAQKAAVMSDRSLILVNNILENSELADVIGSSEGKFGGTDQPTGALPIIGGFISDKEAEAIADIEEITNILTVPAMKIMTGILSESDLKLLKTISGGAFNRTRGVERFKKDVGQIQRILNTASIIGKLPPRDREAAVWATDKKNMNTPQAKQIRNKLGLNNG